MKNIVIILTMGLLALGGARQASADGWNLLAWNPFDRDEDRNERVEASISDDSIGEVEEVEEIEETDESGFFLPWSGRRSSTVTEMPDRPVQRREQQPSVWSKMNRSTRTFFGKAKRAVTPWDDEEQRTASRPRSRRPIDTSRESSFFGGLFAEEPEQGPDTVTDFLKMERPKP